jgi:hypothetical protein
MEPTDGAARDIGALHKSKAFHSVRPDADIG